MRPLWRKLRPRLSSESRPQLLQSLAEDCDVERVIRGDAGVAARLHEDAARVVGGGTRPAFGTAAARPGAGLASLIRGIRRVGARSKNRLAGHCTADAQDVGPCARLRRE